MKTLKRQKGILPTALLLGISVACVIPARAESKSTGKAAYLKYCSACHGAGGQGDGVVSGLMQPPPTDLTKLASKTDFPFMKVAHAIDGRTAVRAHGDPNMPVWGELLQSEPAGGAAVTKEAEVRGKVMAITQYVRSIQEK